MKDKLMVSRIVIYIKKIQKYTKDMDYGMFIKNEVVVEACVFNLSQIGELANKLSKEFQNKNPGIPWQELYGLRNRIVHDYDGVNLKLVWEIISGDLLELKRNLEGCLR